MTLKEIISTIPRATYIVVENKNGHRGFEGFAYDYPMNVEDQDVHTFYPGNDWKARKILTIVLK